MRKILIALALLTATAGCGNSHPRNTVTNNTVATETVNGSNVVTTVNSTNTAR